MQVIRHHLLQKVIGLKIQRHMQLGEGKQDGRPCSLVLEGAIGELSKQLKILTNLFFGRIRAILAKDPGDDLHERIRDVRVLLQDLKVDLHGALPELFTLLGSFVLTDGPDELVGQILSDLITTNLEELIHIPHVPVLVGCEILAEIRNLGY